MFSERKSITYSDFKKEFLLFDFAKKLKTNNLYDIITIYVLFLRLPYETHRRIKRELRQTETI